MKKNSDENFLHKVSKIIHPIYIFLLKKVFLIARICKLCRINNDTTIIMVKIIVYIISLEKVSLLGIN